MLIGDSGSPSAPLPENVQAIADVIGRERALYLAGQCIRWDRTGRHGRRGWLYIPKSLDQSHPLARLAGLEDAHKLVRAFGGEILMISPCAAVIRRWRKAEGRRMASVGLTHTEISASLGITRRHLCNLLRDD